MAVFQSGALFLTLEMPHQGEVFRVTQTSQHSIVLGEYDLHESSETYSLDSHRISINGRKRGNGDILRIEEAHIVEIRGTPSRRDLPDVFVVAAPLVLYHEVMPSRLHTHWARRSPSLELVESPTDSGICGNCKYFNFGSALLRCAVHPLDQEKRSHSECLDKEIGESYPDSSDDGSDDHDYDHGLFD
jgi:hypothetical protein